MAKEKTEKTKKEKSTPKKTDKKIKTETGKGKKKAKVKEVPQPQQQPAQGHAGHKWFFISLAAIVILSVAFWYYYSVVISPSEFDDGLDDTPIVEEESQGLGGELFDAQQQNSAVGIPEPGTFEGGPNPFEGYRNPFDG